MSLKSCLWTKFRVRTPTWKLLLFSFPFENLYIIIPLIMNYGITNHGIPWFCHLVGYFLHVIYIRRSATGRKCYAKLWIYNQIIISIMYIFFVNMVCLPTCYDFVLSHFCIVDRRSMFYASTTKRTNTIELRCVLNIYLLTFSCFIYFYLILFLRIFTQTPAMLPCLLPCLFCS